VVADVEDLDDVRVLQLGNGFRVVAQPFHVLRVSPTQVHHFQGDQPVQRLLAGLVNHAHPTFAQNRVQVVTGDRGQRRIGLGEGPVRPIARCGSGRRIRR
jgi:hypothetical protein